MRELFILLISAWLYFSCHSYSDTANLRFRNETVRLKHGLGLISLAIPSRFDTVLFWTRFSDCTSCGFEQIRFQRKNYPIFLESGFYWKGDPIDSVDEITISQPREFFAPDTTIVISKSEHLLIVEEYDKDPQYFPVTGDTLMEINAKRYSIVFADHFDSTSKVFQQTFVAQCRLKGNNIWIKFRHWARDKKLSKFYEECLHVMRSIRFVNGH